MTVDEILKEMRGNEWDDPHLDRDGMIAARRLAMDWADRIGAAINEERSRHGSELFESVVNAGEMHPKQNHERFSSFDDAVAVFFNSGEAGRWEIPTKVVNWNWHHWNLFVLWLFKDYRAKEEVVKAKKGVIEAEFLSAMEALMKNTSPYDMTPIANILSEDLDKSEIEFDTENITGDPEEAFNMPGFAFGTDSLPKGTPVWWFGAGGDCEMPVAFCLYLGDDGKIHAYVPKDGNCYNKEKNAAFGNAVGFSAADEMSFLGIEYKFDMDKMRADASKALEGGS